MTLAYQNPGGTSGPLNTATTCEVTAISLRSSTHYTNVNVVVVPSLPDGMWGVSVQRRLHVRRCCGGLLHRVPR